MVSQHSMEGESGGSYLCMRAPRDVDTHLAVEAVGKALSHHGRVVHHGMKLYLLHAMEAQVVVQVIKAHFHRQLLAEALVERAGALITGCVGEAKLQRPLAPLVPNPGLLVELGDALVLKERNRETSQKPKKRRSESEKQLRSQKKRRRLTWTLLTKVTFPGTYFSSNSWWLSHSKSSCFIERWYSLRALCEKIVSWPLSRPRTLPSGAPEADASSSSFIERWYSLRALCEKTLSWPLSRPRTLPSGAPEADASRRAMARAIIAVLVAGGAGCVGGVCYSLALVSVFLKPVMDVAASGR